MKRNLRNLMATAAAIVLSGNISGAQTPGQSQIPNQPQQPPPAYPVPPSPVPAPNQIPQDPTIPKLSLPMNAPTDSIFKKIDNEDKPFKLQRSDTLTHDSQFTPKN